MGFPVDIFSNFVTSPGFNEKVSDAERVFDRY